MYNLTITLRPELYRYLRLAASYLGIDANSLIQRMLHEHLEAYLAEGRQRVQEIRRLLEEFRGGPPSE